MVQVFTDDDLIYDSRLEAYDLEELTAETGVNVGGTATIKMPQGHPAYNRFVPCRTIVSIFRDGKRRFRGRCLCFKKSFYKQRTVICEGELCFLRDAIIRPYSFNDTPENVFKAILEAYNEQVDHFKQFVVGDITVTDPAGSIQLESTTAETALHTVQLLIERCGGTITFTDNENGHRVINWLAASGRKSSQIIEFGENLLDFSSSESDEDGIITGLIPYGAKDKYTGKPITIESVNNGKDYILAADAVERHGIIMGTVTFDDISSPAVLLEKAQEQLAELKRIITALKLTAVDLSTLDKSLDMFSVGDLIFVRSSPHNVSEYFQLMELTENFLNPASSTISLGKNDSSLSVSSAAGDSASSKDLEKVKVVAEADRQSTNARIRTLEIQVAELIAKES